jgi:hypothetical protein
MSGVTTRVRGLAPWRPQKRTLPLLTNVRSVLAEYLEYQPLTIRQIFYRLVGVYSYAKTEKAYHCLCEMLNRARRGGMIPFDAIRDDGITLAEPTFWDDATEFIEAVIRHGENFRLDRQIGQPQRLIFAVEAAGMIPMIRAIADPFGITVGSCGGFDSTTAKYDMAVKLGRWPHVLVLHVGDHDPSGVHMFIAIMEDVQAIAADLGLATDIQFSRLVVTPQQIKDLHLDTAPLKLNKKGEIADKRRFEGETTQAEAIAPDIFANIIRTAIDERTDKDALARVLAEETAIRERLVPRLAALRDVDGEAQQ